jgi:hypothetical protein
VNERFKELFIQVRNESENMRWNIEDAETFAELIVRECIDWCDAHATVDGTATKIAESIREHFGVEE